MQLKSSIIQVNNKCEQSGLNVLNYPAPVRCQTKLWEVESKWRIFLIVVTRNVSGAYLGLIPGIGWKYYCHRLGRK